MMNITKKNNNNNKNSEEDVVSSGGAFQMRGAATAKAPLPTVESLTEDSCDWCPPVTSPPANIYREEISPGDFIPVKCLPPATFHMVRSRRWAEK